MRPDSIRMRVSIFLLGTALVAGSVALAQTPALVGRFTAVTANVSGAGDNVRIEMLKWSTDADRDQFLNVWKNPVATIAAAPAPAAAAPAAGGGGGGGGRGGRGGGGAPPAAGAAPAGPPATTPPAAAPAAGDAAAPPAAAAAGGGRGGAGRGGAGRGGNAAAAGGAPPLPGDAAAAGGAAGGGRGGGGRGGGGAAAADAPPPTPESALADALQKANTVGILWTSESAGYSIKYAYKTTTPEGGERIIFATDRRLGGWSDQWWKPAGTAAATNLPFTVFEIRFGATGDGEGRTTLTGKVSEDAAAKSIAVDSYSTQPVVFKTVKKVK